MLPDLFTICLAILSAVLLRMLIHTLPEKLESFLEMSIIVAYIASLFVHFFYQSIDIFLSTIAYVTFYQFGVLFDRGKREKRKQLIDVVRENDVVEIEQTKTYSRLIIDLLLTAFVMAGGILFFIFAPETYSLMKFIVILAFIFVFEKTLERISNYMSTKMYWLPETEKLVILSRFQSREYPIADLKAVETESSPDILKLHPLFTFLSSNLDFTRSNRAVLKLSFPGEYVFLTPNQLKDWVSKLQKFVPIEQGEQAEKKVLPFWHPTVLKRLFWKGYFAVAVKGISAYTSLILILILLNVSSWVIVMAVLSWWLLNLYVSDRVLIAATDAKRVTEGELYERAQAIFQRANLKNPQLFITDSPVYNGFATGMNIGRSTIILTKATMELSNEAVEAILAHETMHVKKRDVLIVQLARIVFMGILALLVYQFYDQLLLLAERTFLLIAIVYSAMILFPLFLSFVSQWTEVRADHLGAKLLPGGNGQMAAGLRELALASEKDIDKSIEYQRVNDENRENRISELERQPWFIRLIAFQFQAHPPMYWRIHSLETYQTWKKARKGWMYARITESLPNF